MNANLKIKPLEWEDCGEEMGFCAENVLGRYWVGEVHGKWQARLLTLQNEEMVEIFVVRGVGFEEARTAAQNDFGTRGSSAFDVAFDLKARKMVGLKAFHAWAKRQGNFNLGIMYVDGRFSHFMDPDTDTAWLGWQACAKAMFEPQPDEPQAEGGVPSSQP